MNAIAATLSARGWQVTCAALLLLAGGHKAGGTSEAAGLVAAPASDPAPGTGEVHSEHVRSGVRDAPAVASRDQAGAGLGPGRLKRAEGGR